MLLSIDCHYVKILVVRTVCACITTCVCACAWSRNGSYATLCVPCRNPVFFIFFFATRSTYATSIKNNLIFFAVLPGPSPAGGQWFPIPLFKSVPPISRLALRLQHTSNNVVNNVAPLVIFGPPAAKSWRRACVLASCCSKKTSATTNKQKEECS